MDLLIDVSITSPCTSGNLSKASTHLCAAAEAAELGKITKYSNVEHKTWKLCQEKEGSQSLYGWFIGKFK